MTDILRKQFRLAGDNLKTFLKQLAETGEGIARFAVINEKDHDNDVMLPGAFGVGQWSSVQPAHNWGHVPLGKALIVEEVRDVLAHFKLNLKIESARDWQAALKFDLETGTPIQEWSWGFDLIKSHMGTDADGDNVRFFEEVKVIEVSPVLRGAGSDTGTVSVKSRKHTTATSVDLWSRAENEARVKADSPGEVYATDDAKFLHHFIDDDGRAGAASVKACRDGIAVLNGECGGATVSEDQKQAVYDHLANHLKDAGETAPELKAVNSGRKLTDEMDDVIQSAYDLQDSIDDLAVRLKGVKDLRAGKGRELSARKIGEINAVIESVKNLHTLDVVVGQDPAITEQVAKAKARFLKRHLN